MSAQDSVNPNGQPQTVAATGTTEQENAAEIGSQNIRGTFHEKQQQTQTKEAETQIPIEKQPPEAQPQTKEERHASKKITELAEDRIKFARLAVEGNAQAIYKIAEDDPKLAEKLLQEFDFGTDSVEELLALQKNPDAKPEEVKKQVVTDSKIQELEKRVLDETIKRLKKDHPDLEGDLEKEFRDMYSNPTFSKYDEEKKIDIARAALGIKPKGPSNEILLEMLKQQEGSLSPAKTRMPMEKTKRIPNDAAKIYKSAGVTEKDLEKFLPEDIDDIIATMYYHGAKVNAGE